MLTDQLTETIPGMTYAYKGWEIDTVSVMRQPVYHVSVTAPNGTTHNLKSVGIDKHASALNDAVALIDSITGLLNEVEGLELA